MRTISELVVADLNSSFFSFFFMQILTSVWLYAPSQNVKEMVKDHLYHSSALTPV